MSLTQETQETQKTQDTLDNEIEALRQQFSHPERVVQACVLRQRMQEDTYVVDICENIFPERANYSGLGHRCVIAAAPWPCASTCFEYCAHIDLLPQCMLQLPQEMYEDLFSSLLSEYVLK